MLTFARALTVRLFHDEAGFIVSGELVLVSTIAVLAMIVGLSELAHNVNEELEDVGTAFGKMTQTYQYNGTKGHKGSIDGSYYNDRVDFCDSWCDIVSTPPTGEI